MAPRYTQWDGFVTPDDNQKEFDFLSSSPVKHVLEQPAKGSQDFVLYQLHQRIFALDHQSDRLVFDVQFEIESIVMDGHLLKTVRQETLFRDSHTPSARYLPSHVFWQYIINQAPVAVTSPDQTGFGRRFWEERISEAFSKQKSVAHWNKATDVIRKFQSHAEFVRDADLFWGDEADFANSRIIIF